VVTGGDGDMDDDRRSEASPGTWSRYLCASSNVVERQLESPRASKCFGHGRLHCSAAQTGKWRPSGEAPEQGRKRETRGRARGTGFPRNRAKMAAGLRSSGK
jgi:hypothetical protein